MRKEHYEHVASVFNLREYAHANRAEDWEMDYEGCANTSMVRAMSWDVARSTWSVGDGDIILFVSLPSEQFANDIVLYIKNTEMFFV